MKRWVHASTSSDSDWKNRWNPEERFWYWELVTDKGRGVLRFEDDEKEGYYNCSIEIPGQADIEVAILGLEDAMAYVDSYLY